MENSSVIQISHYTQNSNQELCQYAVAFEEEPFMHKTVVKFCIASSHSISPSDNFGGIEIIASRDSAKEMFLGKRFLRNGSLSPNMLKVRLHVYERIRDKDVKLVRGTAEGFEQACRELSKLGKKSRLNWDEATCVKLTSLNKLIRFLQGDCVKEVIFTSVECVQNHHVGRLVPPSTDFGAFRLVVESTFAFESRTFKRPEDFARAFPAGILVRACGYTVLMERHLSFESLSKFELREKLVSDIAKIAHEVIDEREEFDCFEHGLLDGILDVDREDERVFARAFPAKFDGKRDEKNITGRWLSVPEFQTLHLISLLDARLKGGARQELLACIRRSCELK
jgi:hypothetical protein